MNLPEKPLPWSEKVRERDSAERARFLESHIDLVKYLALRFCSRLPANVEVEDLVSDGILGLLDATEKYDPSRGVRFRTYADSRVRGAILDGLRRKDWRPRSVRSLQRKVDAALAEISALHQRPASTEEIAEALGLDLEAYRSQTKDINAGALLSLQDLPSGTHPATSDATCRPDAPLEKQDLLMALADELELLPDRECRVLELYYHEGLNMKEVGALMGITESRVCQLHSQAARRLREALSRRLHPEPVVETVPEIARPGRA